MLTYSEKDYRMTEICEAVKKELAEFKYGSYKVCAGTNLRKDVEVTSNVAFDVLDKAVETLRIISDRTDISFSVTPCTSGDGVTRIWLSKRFRKSSSLDTLVKVIMAVIFCREGKLKDVNVSFTVPSKVPPRFAVVSRTIYRDGTTNYPHAQEVPTGSIVLVVGRPSPKSLGIVEAGRTLSLHPQALTAIGPEDEEYLGLEESNFTEANHRIMLPEKLKKHYSLIGGL